MKQVRPKKKAAPAQRKAKDGLIERRRLGKLMEMTLEEAKQWVDDRHRKAKIFDR
jgi:hypothetical protein